ncbi:hypothetical protein PUN28_010183 [Cardiocondyla obscurior]|uniref:Uncharacterized protein n=1 Tax=Cardiocondyla obscurior TaxID=286306 RepID=A0AAW2FTE6_9HYME
MSVERIEDERDEWRIGKRPAKSLDIEIGERERPSVRGLPPPEGKKSQLGERTLMPRNLLQRITKHA